MKASDVPLINFFTLKAKEFKFLKFDLIRKKIVESLLQLNE